MDILKSNFAKKLFSLRTKAGMTQSELGDKLSYSDKTVSKWERGEAIPDAGVLKKISRIFSVSVDSLLDDGEEGTKELPAAGEKGRAVSIYPSVTRVIMAGIWTAALLIFVLLWVIVDIRCWMVFAYALPVSGIAMLVFNSIWNRGKGNFWIVSFLVISTIAVAYLGVLEVKNAWPLFLLVLPAELLVWLSFRIRKKRK